VSDSNFFCKKCDFSKLFHPIFRLNNDYTFLFYQGIIKNIITSGIYADKVVSFPLYIECTEHIIISLSLFSKCKNMNSPGGAILCICNTSEISINKCTFDSCSSYGTFSSEQRSSAGGGAVAIHCSAANISGCSFSYCTCSGLGSSFYIGCPFRQTVNVELVSLFCIGTNQTSEGNSWCIDRANTNLNCLNNTNPNMLYHTGGHVGYYSEYANIKYMLVMNSAAFHIYGNALAANSSICINDHCSFINHTAFIAIIQYYIKSHRYSNCVFNKLTGKLITKNYQDIELIYCYLDSHYITEPLNQTFCFFTEKQKTDLPLYCSPERLFEPSKNIRSQKLYYLVRILTIIMNENY